jgi:predicted nuclease of predicted toxin-antitoxin system
LKPPDPPTFFLDRCLGKETIASAMRSAGALVQVHDDNFAPDAKDEEWLVEVGAKGWVVLTKDKRFQNRTLEIRAIARSNVRVFKLTAGSIQGVEMAEIFVKVIRKISGVARSNRSPFIATVSKSGRVRIEFTAARLKRYR